MNCFATWGQRIWHLFSRDGHRFNSHDYTFICYEMQLDSPKIEKRRMISRLTITFSKHKKRPKSSFKPLFFFVRSFSVHIKSQTHWNSTLCPTMDSSDSFPRAIISLQSLSEPSGGISPAGKIWPVHSWPEWANTLGLWLPGHGSPDLAWKLVKKGRLVHEPGGGVSVSIRPTKQPKAG